MVVKSYDGSKYLTTSKSEHIKITPKDDIGEVEQEYCDNEMNDAEIVSVTYINTHKACITCKGKVDIDDDKIGICSKCSTSQRLDKCNEQISAKLIVAAGDKRRTLVAFLPIIHQIIKDDTTDVDEITTQLLMSDPCTLTFSAKDIINSVNRK